MISMPENAVWKGRVRTLKPVAIEAYTRDAPTGTKATPSGLHIVGKDHPFKGMRIRASVKRPLVLPYERSQGRVPPWVSQLVNEYGKRGPQLTEFLLKNRVDSILIVKKNRVVGGVIFEEAPTTKVHYFPRDEDLLGGQTANQVLDDYFGLQEKDYTVSLDSEEEYLDLAEMDLFGRNLTEEEIFVLSGAAGLPIDKVEIGYSVTEGDYGQPELKIVVMAPGMVDVMIRIVTMNEVGELVLKNDVLVLEKGQIGGIGAMCAFSQALKAREMGFEHIECNAYRDDKLDPPFIGHLVWAKYGFNMDLSNYLEPVDLDELERAGLIEDSLNATMHELMSTPEGQTWWKENGDTWDATFSLRDDENGNPSDCMKFLEIYMRARAARDGGDLESWLARRAMQGEFTPEESALLDAVWQRFAQWRFEKNTSRRVMARFASGV